MDRIQPILVKAGIASGVVIVRDPVVPKGKHPMMELIHHHSLPGRIGLLSFVGLLFFPGGPGNLCGNSTAQVRSEKRFIVGRWMRESRHRTS